MVIPFRRPAAIALLCAAACSCAHRPVPTPLPVPPSLSAEAARIRASRRALEGALEAVRRRSDLFPPKALRGKRLLPWDGRQAALDSWQEVFEAQRALEEVLARRPAAIDLRRGAEVDAEYEVGYAAYVAHFRYATEFIARAEKDPSYDILFNDPDRRRGLPGGAYGAMKNQFNSAARAVEFALHAALRATRGGGGLQGLVEGVEEDAGHMYRQGVRDALRLAAGSRLDDLERLFRALWYPALATAANWMGEARLRRSGVFLVSHDQVRALRDALRPGDILLTRREWRWSNLGVPGYWVHSALYVGAPEERRRHLNDEDVRAWVRAQGVADGDLEALLQQRHPRSYRLSLRPRTDGTQARIIEGFTEGICLTTLEWSTLADAIAVLRPRLAGRDIAAAIDRAFGYHGRPYDFNFEFLTDSSLICTELIYKCYEMRGGGAGLRLPVREVFGRMLMPANDLVRHFDATYGTPEQELDLVRFFDPRERERRAVEGSLEEFRGSWRRSRFHVLSQIGWPW